MIETMVMPMTKTQPARRWVRPPFFVTQRDEHGQQGGGAAGDVEGEDCCHHAQSCAPVIWRICAERSPRRSMTSGIRRAPRFRLEFRLRIAMAERCGVQLADLRGDPDWLPVGRWPFTGWAAVAWKPPS